jgi:hypothetical protein
VSRPAPFCGKKAGAYMREMNSSLGGSGSSRSAYLREMNSSLGGLSRSAAM